MGKVSCLELKRILSNNLENRIDQRVIEDWSTKFWQLTQKQQRSESCKDPFVMMFPPPNITGNLHLGHALTAVVQDALLRQRKMEGRYVSWIPGFDHAGLATQSIVEKQLYNRMGIRRQEYGRENFINLANEWKDLKRNEMRNQLDRLGLSLDYEKEYFTLDQKSSLAVNAAFKQLFNSGHIYRDTKAVYWSSQLNTTLSDIEVEKVNGVDRYFRTGEVVHKKDISQWFISAKDMAHRSVEVVKNGSIKIIPPNYKNSWSAWLLDNGVHDWCISRQSWWGHRIPVYKLRTKDDRQGNWIIADSEVEAKAKLKSDDIVQDPDVLDTWFSSSLLPLTISGWPDEDAFRNSCDIGLFPLHIMETGFDILNYWVSKMVMMSIALTDKIPFNLVLLHGMICDHDGKKMSKSIGNVIDPLDLIDGVTLSGMLDRTQDLCSQGIIEEKNLANVLINQKKLFPRGIPACGSDGLRAYLLSHDIQEEVVKISISQIEKIRRLSNKIWNIYRYLFAILKESNLKCNLDRPEESRLDQSDKQILSHLDHCIELSHVSFKDDLQLHRAFNSLELFWTIHLSSNYIQANKELLLNGDSQIKLQVLVVCILTATKLLHPFMPHLTEYLYQKFMLDTDMQIGLDWVSISHSQFPSRHLALGE